MYSFTNHKEIWWNINENEKNYYEMEHADYSISQLLCIFVRISNISMS